MSYSDNPRAISEKLHELAPEWTIVWAFNNPKEKKKIVPSYVKCISTSSLFYIYHQATSGFWIDNYCLPTDTIKRKGQKYIQTWHGDRGMKKILADMCEDKSNYSLFESHNCDLAVAGSLFGERTYRSSFLYDGEILTVGSPKNDILIKGDVTAVKRVKEYYGISDNVKLLLYAPTFRDTNKTNIQKVEELDFSEILHEFEKKSGDKWLLLARGHTGRRLILNGDSDYDVIDVSDYEDSKYLLLVADAVISDYGSIPTDYALLGRPIFFYMYDIEEYEKTDRSLRFSVEHTPYWYAKNQDELIMLIRNYTKESVIKNCKEILDFYETRESGEASKRVCEYMLSKQ